MAMFGANVDELDAIANQMDQASRTLASSRARISSQVSNSAWVGPIADRFRSEWISTNSGRLASAVELLSSAATTLRQNAEQQSQASAVDTSSASGTSSLSSGEDPITRFGDLLAILGNGDEALSDVNLLSDLKFLADSPLKSLDEHLGAIGLVLSAGAVAVDVKEHDVIAALMDGASGAAGAVSTGFAIAAPIIGTTAVAAAATGVSVIGAGIGALVGFVNLTTPYSSSSQDAMFTYEIKQHFGANTPVDPENLTAVQSAFISQRYENPFGVAQMISDKMSQSANSIDQAVAKSGESVVNAMAPAVENVASGVGTAATDFGSFVGSLFGGSK